MPHKTLLYVAMALVALGYVALQARDIRARFWIAPASALGARRRRAAFWMLLLTAPVVLAFMLIGRYLARPLLTGGLIVSLALYVPWAAVQQTLFQFYFHGRIRALFADRGLCAHRRLLRHVHLPDIRLVVLTTCAGFVWSHCYQRDRCLVPLAASHALLGATFYAWVEGQSALGALLRVVGA